MTQNTSNSSSSEAVVMVVATAVFIAGAFLGLSSLLGARWWVNLIIILVAAGSTLAVSESDPDTGLVFVGLLVLFSLYGFVSTLGWIATVAIVLVSTVLVVLLLSEKPASEPPARRPPPVRAIVPAPSSPPPPPDIVSDEVLERYAREFLADGGTRDTRAVIAALRSHVRDEGLKLGPTQDLSWIASRVLASSRSSAPPTGPRRTPPAPERPTAPRQQGVPAAPAKQRANARQHLHEFGSFEIERAISRVLDDSPGLTDEHLADRVLGALGISDRSPFAVERLSDAIGRVRGNVSPSAEGRVLRERERRMARVSQRDPGGRTKLYEYGSHEIERVVEQLLPADRRWVEEELLEAVLEVLGIEDRSNLARQRVADAAVKVSASVAYPPGAGGRLRRPVPKKKPAKKAVKKQSAPKPAAKKVRKKTTEARKGKTEAAKSTAEDAKRQKPASKPERDRQTGRKTPPPAPEKKPTRPEGEPGAPDAKDIGKLLGF